MKYPLLFTRRELVEGNGFVAGVAVSGRALLNDGDSEFWVEGVNPGGFAANGCSPKEALAELSSTLRSVLYDIAFGARDFEEFRAEVVRFYEETCEPAAVEWDEAVQKVRAGELIADWLVKRPAESPLGIEVVLIRHPTAENNQLGDASLAA